MKELNPIAIINKYKFWIIIISLLAGAGFSVFLSQNQSYTATAMIEYRNEQAKAGLAPDGTKIDTSEIYCAEVMKEVFTRMDLNYSDYNLDLFRSKIVVTPVLSDEELAVQEGMNERGEEYEIEPTKYMISMTLDKEDAREPEVFARQVMDNMLDVFQRMYAENHVGSSVAVNDIVELQESNFDYIEGIEAIETRVVETLNSLSQYVSNQYTFRSATTGYSFSDLYREFELLHSNEISKIYSYILSNKLTKNKEVLIAKYQQRIEDYNIDLELSSGEIEDIKEVIETYVTMMRESGNTDITYEYILDQVYNGHYQSDGTGVPLDETVEYDVLLEQYIKNRMEYEYILIDVAYCQYILDTYAQAQSVNTRKTSALAGEVERKMDTLMSKLDILYERLSDVQVEFSEYTGAMNVGLISNIVVEENVKILLYSIIAVIAFALILSTAVIVLGRMSEIFEYYIYTDHKLLIPNRNGCDRYLKQNKDAVLSEDFACISIHVTDIPRKNNAYGREQCDKMVNKLIEIIQKIFPGEPNGFLAVNSFGQFVIFQRSMPQKQVNTYMDAVNKEVSSYNEEANCPIEYRWGMAETGEEQVGNIHELMIAAIKRADSSEAVVVESQE